MDRDEATWFRKPNRIVPFIFASIVIWTGVSCENGEWAGTAPTVAPRISERVVSAEPSSDRLLIQTVFSQPNQQNELTGQYPYNIDDYCAQCILSAQQSIDLAVFEIDNNRIIDALLQVHYRGVKIRIVTDADYENELGPRLCRQAGIPILVDNRTAFMHNKFMVIDSRYVWTGSFNFTENCAKKNNNNAVFIQDDHLAANYQTKFNWFWENHQFGAKPRGRSNIPHPIIELTDGTVVENYFSTTDPINRRILEILSNARHSIKFCAFSFTDDELGAMMAWKARQGVKVAGVFETRQASEYSEFERLLQTPNTLVWLDSNPYNMHHKFIIIDNVVVITGSYNFSKSASESNDENILILHNPHVAWQYDQEFKRIYLAAQNLLASNPNIDAKIFNIK